MADSSAARHPTSWSKAHRSRDPATAAAPWMPATDLAPIMPPPGSGNRRVQLLIAPLESPLPASNPRGAVPGGPVVPRRPAGAGAEPLPLHREPPTRPLLVVDLRGRALQPRPARPGRDRHRRGQLHHRTAGVPQGGGAAHPGHRPPRQPGRAAHRAGADPDQQHPGRAAGGGRRLPQRLPGRGQLGPGPVLRLPDPRLEPAAVGWDRTRASTSATPPSTCPLPRRAQVRMRARGLHPGWFLDVDPVELWLEPGETILAPPTRCTGPTWRSRWATSSASSR